jgi:hypothetical protein
MRIAVGALKLCLTLVLGGGLPHLLGAQRTPTLHVVFPGGQATLDVAELSALPRDSAKARIHEGPEHWYSGPSLIAVLRRAGARVDTVRGPALAQYVLAEAQDGYRVLFSLAELAPGLGNLRVILADRMDGKLITSAEDGPFRLVVPTESRPTRWARQIVSLRVAAATP